ncbi:MAG TPA: pyruvate kinase, partial [Nitrospira sp.]|nr:pyruvate kinase [Nitrospira sp.]
MNPVRPILLLSGRRRLVDRPCIDGVGCVSSPHAERCMQKTRIICTIGPATDSYEMLQKLYDAGMS